jgi:hypothetical protein
LTPEVVPYNTLLSLRNRGRVEIARQGKGEGNYALIIYDSLPAKYRQRYEQKYGDPKEQIKQETMTDRLKPDAKAREFFEAFSYRLKGVQTRLNDKLIAEYTLNAQVLNALIKEHNDRAVVSRALNNSRGDLWDILTESCERLRENYHHTLPSNASRLRSKIAAYKRDGYAALISGKIGNSNTLKITNEAGRLLIALKRSRVPVFTDSQIWTRFNEVEVPRHNAQVGQDGELWKPLRSLKSLTMWFAQPDIEPLWYDAIHGELKARQKFGRKHRTELPICRDSLWYGDGTKLNLYYRDDNGKVATTMVYEVIDAYSEALLGYHIADSEDYDAQYNAFRMAVQVSGHKPYEVVTDNQGGSKTKRLQEFYGKIAHVHRPTAPYNPQSKTIEGIFGRFQQQVLRQDWRFTGQNVTATKADSKPNLEFLRANPDKLFTLQELKVRYAEMREMWNGTRAMETTGALMTHYATGLPRMEMYKASANDDAPEVTAQDMEDMFWIMTEKPSVFTSSGIEITVKGRKYAYEVMASAGKPDHEWRSGNTNRSFFVKYDPNDMLCVKLYRQDKSGALRFERVAEPYMEIHRGIADQTEGEAKFIRQEQAAAVNDRIERIAAAKEIEWEHGVAPEQHGLSSPELRGLTAEENDRLQATIERRVRKYRDQTLEPGKNCKLLSLDDWLNQDGEIEIDYKRVAGKL